ncbi:hypothetical protein ACFQ9X_08485 [Catenulispora yoronensis]
MTEQFAGPTQEPVQEPSQEATPGPDSGGWTGALRRRLFEALPRSASSPTPSPRMSPPGPTSSAS